jgi:hypothetical protein
VIQRAASKNPVILGSLPAMRRAAKAALRLAKETGTPCYVVKDGRIVNLNPVRGKRPSARRKRNAGWRD